MPQAYAGTALLIAAILLIFSRAGMALMHTGLIRSKSAVNTMSLHWLALAISVLAYMVVGNFIEVWVGSGFQPIRENKQWIVELGHGRAPALYTFCYLAMLFSIAAAIPIGALAERWKMKSFVTVLFVLSGILIPFWYGSIVEQGWAQELIGKLLNGRSVLDDAGAATIHLFGGVIAFCGIRAIGPRIGKYDYGRPRAFFGHNMPMVLFSAFLFAAGWLGTSFATIFNDVAMANALVALLVAMAAAVLAAAAYMTKRYGKPDPSMIASAAIAGLVATSGGAQYFAPWSALITGALAGVLACWGIIFLESKGLDDPAGVVSIHGICGLWGVIAVGLFANGPFEPTFFFQSNKSEIQGLFMGDGQQFLAQLLLAAGTIIFAGITGTVLFKIVNRVAGPNRLPGFIETGGLDTHEMGLPAYPEFTSMSSERSLENG